MKYWLRGQRGGLIAFLAIATLVVGGLGWVTDAALRLEQGQQEARAQADRSGKLHVALWRMDGLVSPVLAKEDSRPYNHYSAIYVPNPALRNDGMVCEPGTILEPSPLLSAELPPWILLHFQTDADSGWGSPQVLSKTLTQKLTRLNLQLPTPAALQQRERLLAELSGRCSPKNLLALVQPRGDKPIPEGWQNTVVLPNYWDFNSSVPGQGGQQVEGSEYARRFEQQNIVKQQSKAAPQNDEVAVAVDNTKQNGENWLARNPRKPARGEQALVTLDTMIPFWLTGDDGQETLLEARLVRIGAKQVCQGIVLDWPRLQTLLAERVGDLFPEGRILPVLEKIPPHPENTMSALPIELDPGPLEPAVAHPGWTPLRVGLALAWMAALLALLAVGLGGWSLIDLSERRIRFVSAVTHELRTPLTTLRLYLDMLAGGMVKETERQTEYLQTLNVEADRLSRLVGNVLDFSRLENQRPRLEKTEIPLADLLEQVRATWQGRCQGVEKELVIDNAAGDNLLLFTDVQMVQQIVGNLIDNACKYSRDAEDRRIWLRALQQDPQRLVLEVEDKGPGIAAGEQRSIFRPFRRGRGADVTAGGVGLGLALAQRWTQLLGGKLTLRNGPGAPGACFRLELPAILR